MLRAKTFVQLTEEKLEPSYHKERSLRVSSSNTGGRSPLSTHTPIGRRQASYMSGGVLDYIASCSIYWQDHVVD